MADRVRYNIAFLLSNLDASLILELLLENDVLDVDEYDAASSKENVKSDLTKYVVRLMLKKTEEQVDSFLKLIQHSQPDVAKHVANTMAKRRDATANGGTDRPTKTRSADHEPTLGSSSGKCLHTLEVEYDPYWFTHKMTHTHIALYMSLRYSITTKIIWRYQVGRHSGIVGQVRKLRNETNTKEHTWGAFELSLFDFLNSFVFLKRWPYWPLQKNEAPRNSSKLHNLIRWERWISSEEFGIDASRSTWRWSS